MSLLYYKLPFMLSASVNALWLHYNLLMKYDNHQMVQYLLWTRFKASPFCSYFQKWDWAKYTAVPTLKYYQYLPHCFHLVSETHLTKWLLKNAPKFNFCNNLRNYNLHIDSRDFLRSSCVMTATLYLHLSAAMDSSIPGKLKWKSCSQ